MDFSPLFQAIVDNTLEVRRLANILEKAAGGAVSTGEAVKKGRPTKEEVATRAAAANATTAPTAAAVQPVSSAVVTPSTPQTTAAATVGSPASAGPFKHADLKDLFLAYAKQHGRDKIVALMGEFGAVEFAKVKTDDLLLFKDRLEGKPQTPVASSDMANLLGM